MIMCPCCQLSMDPSNHPCCVQDLCMPFLKEGAPTHLHQLKESQQKVRNDSPLLTLNS